ncbi:MAG: DUF2207 domain-containing protein [Sphingomicrobium sp.]
MRRLFAALVLAFAVPGAAVAEERILDFDSRIAIQRDGSMQVVETIRVNAENVAINRGIFRDFPTQYDGKRGKRIKVDFNLVSTERDGQIEPSKLERLSNGVRVRIGNPDVIVSVGEHVYRITYRTTRQLGYFSDYDELYWNVTGNGWRFPIDHAGATINLPGDARFGKRAFYTGVQGSIGKAARVVEEGPGTIRFETTAALAPKEGLTVAVAFPKGIVDGPSSSTKLKWFFADWLPPLVAGGGLLALFIFLLNAWRRVGRDPPEGTTVPIFNPPDALTPAAMRYLTRKSFDNRAFAAALVDAAVKGHVKLVEEKGGIFSSTKRFIDRQSTPAAKPLDAAEQASLDVLVGPGERIEMDNDNHSEFSAAMKLLGDRFDKRFSGIAFHRNLGWAFAAVGVWLAVLWATAAVILVSEGAPEAKIALASAFLFGVAAAIWGMVPKSKGTKGCMIQAVPFVIAGLGALLALPTIPAALAAGRWIPLGIAALGLPFALSAFAWMDAPTKEGRAMLDRIAGFKQYLSITERDRLDRMHAPADNIEIFERFLPFAIALDVENRWADRFESVLKAAMAAQATGSAFGWYSGSSNPWSDTGGFVDSIGGALSSAVSSSSTAPGSSSGSGGGGSSGGGGGGGGGGGW